MTNTNIPALLSGMHRLSDRLTSLEAFMNRNVASFGKMVSNIQNVGDIVGNLNASFGKADELQIKSLAIGSDLNKFLEVNEKTLKSMRGSFFDNAEELLKNYVFGIRDNSEVITGMMTRMKQTGQSVDVLRHFIGDLIPVTGGSMEAVDRLVEATGDLEKQYGVTAQSIQEAVLALRPETAFAGLLGFGEEFAGLAMELQAAVKGMGENQLNRVLGFLVDSNNFGAKAMLGVGDSLDRLIRAQERGEAVEVLKSIVDTMNETANRTYSLQNKGLSADIRGIAVTNSGLKELLINTQQLGVILEKNADQGNSARAENARFQDSARTLNQEAMSFYQKSIQEVYPMLLTAIPAIQAAAIGQGIGSLAMGGFGLSRSLGAVANPLTRLLVPVIRFAGPVGLAAGALMTIASFLPDSAKSEKAQVAHLEAIERNTARPEQTKQRIKNTDDLINELVSRNIGLSSASKANGLMTVNEAQLRTLEKINDALERLNRKETNSGFVKGGR